MNKIVHVFTILLLCANVSELHAAQPMPEPSANNPSFSCASPNAIETVICSDPLLAADDRTMAVLYKAAQPSALGMGTSQERKLQRDWLKQRNRDCTTGDIHSCLKDAYDHRLMELAVAALFNAPDASLAEITRQEPKAAPLYKAIYLYATLDNQTERVKAITPLIASVFNEIHTENYWGAYLSSYPDAQTVVSSDTGFALFLDIASIEHHMTLSCSVIVRRPDMIDALGSKFGNSVDGRLIDNNCVATMPALPALDHLVKASTDAQSVCEGTIRFGLGRDYEKTIIAIRLHRINLWNDVMPNSSDDDVDEAQFRSRNSSLIRNAQNELAKYYVQYFKVPQDQANKEARSAANVAVSGAYNLCE